MTPITALSKKVQCPSFSLIRPGKLVLKEKSSWREKDCVLLAAKDFLKINVLSPKDVCTQIERSSHFQGKVDKEVPINTTELFCGIGGREDYSSTSFWVLCTDGKKVQFKAPSWQDRRDWFECMNRALLPKPGI